MADNMRKQSASAHKRRQRRIWRTIRPLVVLVVSVVIVFFAARFTIDYVLSHFIEPVDVNDATPIEVVIPKSSSASTIARILYQACGEDEKGLIPSTAVFKVYVDFVGKANKMQAGTYILSRNMSLKQIVDIICEGNPPKQSIKLTIPEGYTISDIAGVLVDKGLISDASTFLDACMDQSDFESFQFLPELAEGRRYQLEGYLFPDTYEVFVDASAESIIIKMLNRFNEVFTDEYITRAQELGMTMDEVVTLASLIEREAQVDTDFAKVSAVFHNRIQQGMRLESCASLSYVLNVKKYTFTETELATESPYNTYRRTGLPVGPISNPGKLAIEAALYPNQEYLDEGYLYFCNGKLQVTAADGMVTHDYALVFDKTYEEHQQHVLEYSPYWP